MSGRKEAAKDEVPNKGGRRSTDSVQHFCNSYTWELTVFAKCSAANLLLNPTPGRNYGQKADF